MRAAELKPGGLLYVTVIVNNEPELKSYQIKEELFYRHIATVLLPKALSEAGFEPNNQIIAACMKTSVSAFPSDYLDVIKSQQDLELLSHAIEECPDQFHVEYTETKDLEKFARSVSNYIRGFWGEILEEGLRRATTRDPSAVSALLFDTLIPGYLKKQPDSYPEGYMILKLSFLKPLLS